LHLVLTDGRNKTINPSTYKTLDKPQYDEVHAIGEVWAKMLLIVAQRLIAKHGFVKSLFLPAPLKNGTIPLGDHRTRGSGATDAPMRLIPKRT